MRIAMLFTTMCYVCVALKYVTKSHNYSSPYMWKEVTIIGGKKTNASTLLLNHDHTTGQEMVGIPVYVSLTSVSFRVRTLHSTLKTIYEGQTVPSKVFLFLSRSSYLLDKGVERVPQTLATYITAGLLAVVYTENSGPHRKLLPLLQRFLHKDVLIITIDDDLPYEPNSTLIYQLLLRYKNSNHRSVVALRTRRIGLCREAITPRAAAVAMPPNSTKALIQSTLFTNYSRWSLQTTTMTETGTATGTGKGTGAATRKATTGTTQGPAEMFSLPTGTGGVLYRPRFFHPIVFNETFLKITDTTDDMTFRLACMAKNVSVLIVVQKPAGQSSSSQEEDIRMAIREEDHYSSELSKRQLKTSLYAINRRHRNDDQWHAAVEYLEKRDILNMHALLARYGMERERFCYLDDDVLNAGCAIFNCDER